ncbi:hypothetical protein P9209_17005 [Prescottella defluvii]|nr:hypothetical protein P9209_17005 [Prescottella defluvii]
MAPEGVFWNKQMETRPRAEREQEILALLQRQLHHAYAELPFYRRHYDAHDFHPDQVRSLDDFTRLVPVITKQMLRDDQVAHPPFGGYLGVPESEIARVHGSSAPRAFPPCTESRRPIGNT